MKKSIYFDPTKYLPYQRNFILINSERTVGKTYSTQKFQIERALDKAERFVYFVRTQQEKSTGVFQDAYSKVMMEQFPGYDFTFKSNHCFVELDDQQFEIGVCMALSEANKAKRINYPKSRWGLFDEYILEEMTHSDYVSGWNEPNLFLKAYHTIDREQDYLTVFMLANTVEFYNPYHIHPAFNVPPTPIGEVWKSENVVYEHIEASEELKKKKKKSKFLRMIEGTEYGGYAIKGDFINDNDSFIASRTKKAKLQYNFDVGTETFGVWYDNDTGILYIDDVYDKNFSRWYTFDKNRMKEGKTLVVSKEIYILKWTGTMFRRGNVRWTKMEIKGKSLEGLRKIL